jgi:hypothetical protein
MRIHHHSSLSSILTGGRECFFNPVLHQCSLERSSPILFPHRYPERGGKVFIYPCFTLEFSGREFTNPLPSPVSRRGEGMFFLTLFYTCVLWPGVHQYSSLIGIRSEGGGECFFNPVLHWCSLDENSPTLFPLQYPDGRRECF